MDALGLEARERDRVRVPLAPGRFTTVDVESVDTLDERSPIELEGGGVLAYDGERTTPVSPDATVTVEIDPAGPLVIDVAATLRRAVEHGLFDVPPKGP